MEDVRYPIGKYIEQPYAENLFSAWLIDLEVLPQQLEAAVSNLDAYQINTAYRENGWTVNQVVHHLADSHMNAYMRFKLGLTENNPVIKPYDENAWAETPEVKIVPMNVSVTLLFSLHRRWIELLKCLDEATLARTVMHPEHKKEMSLWYLLGMYAWHGKHHVAHINALRSRMGW